MTSLIILTVLLFQIQLTSLAQTIKPTDSTIHTVLHVYLSNPSEYPHISTWNTSLITSLSHLFYDRGYWHNGRHIGKFSSFNEDLSQWDVSNVTNMNSMFLYCGQFNTDVSQWNVSQVTSMSSMFGYDRMFNRNLSEWDTQYVRNMNRMFHNATKFNQDLSTWNVGQVTTMNRMFANATVFNQDLNQWDISKVTYMDYMFANTTTNQVLCWDLSGKNTQHMMDGSRGTISKSYRYCKYQMGIQKKNSDNNIGTMTNVVNNTMKNSEKNEEKRRNIYLVIVGCLFLVAGLYVTRHGWMGEYEEEDGDYYDKYDTPVY